MTRPSVVIRARVRALLERAGHTVTGASRAMGRSHTWLLRKIDAGAGEDRPLTVEDLDELAAFLGLDANALLEPVLLPGDDQVLAYVHAAGLVTADSVSAVFATGRASLDRLEAQGLLAFDEVNPTLIHLTAPGLRARATATEGATKP